MKRLILVRHAKSSWKNAALSDFDRPLSGRGRRDAPRMGEQLAREGVAPDIILVSPAKRARQTTQLLAAALPGSEGRILFDPRLYDANATLLLERVRALDESWREVMLVGHNPGLTDFAQMLIAAAIGDLPTCGVLVAELAIDSWQTTATGCGHSLRYLTPKGLPV